MSTSTARALRVLFYIYAAVTFVHIAYVVYREPFAFDAWNFARDTRAEPFSVQRFFGFWSNEYFHSNPRFGQPFAYLSYKLVGFAEIGTAVAFFAIVVGGFALGTGRLPDRKRGGDLATLAIGIGFLWFASPNLPAYMFCRAYATNYLWMAALQVWFLVALRMHDPEQRTSIRKLVGVGLLGVCVGMANEHTGPTLLLIAAGYTVWTWRARKLRSWFLLVATSSVFVGFALIFFAPGQSERYDEFLKEKFTVTQQILVRGISGNLEIFKGLLLAAGPLLLLLVMMFVAGAVTEKREGVELERARTQQRRVLVVLGLAALAGVLITCTVFASPKLGPRFYLHSMIFLLAAVLGVANAFLPRAKAYAPFVVIALVSSIYAGARTIPMFTRLDVASEERLAQLEAAAPGTVVLAQAWESVNESWWFLGDDFRDQKKREFIAKYYAFRRVLFSGGDAWTTLGVENVKLALQYDFDKEICLDETEQLVLPTFLGRDIGALVHTFTDAVAEILVVNPARLEAIDLVVAFIGSRPPMPREKIYVARWKDQVLESYVAKVTRAGRSKTRTVNLPDSLATEPWEVFMVAVGEQPRRLGVTTEATKFSYQPWASKMYWFLACRPEHCFVVATMNHKI